MSLLSFVHSGYFYSAFSSPLLIRGAPNTAWILCQNFTPKRHRQLWVKDLPKVTCWGHCVGFSLWKSLPVTICMVLANITEREGDKMAHLEHLRSLNQQPKGTPLSGSALRLIHPYSNLHHLVDVCPSSTDSVNNNNDNRHFLLLLLRPVSGGPKQDSVVTWLEHHINPWNGLIVVKNLIPRASILYHTPIAAVSAGIYLYIRQ